MKIIRPVSEDDMVAEFLKGEIFSPRWRKRILNILKKYKLSWELVEKPNINNANENEERKKVLTEFRGYGKDKELFEGFPANLKWYEAELTKDELKKVKYIDYSYWNELSAGTRIPIEAVKKIKKGIEIFNQSNKQFFKIAELYDKGESFPRVILVVNNVGEMELIEGHVRLTGYFLAKNPPKSLTVLLGKP